MTTEECIFCKIAHGSINSSKVFEDEICVAFDDLNPQAPVHILVIPKEHIDSLDKIETEHQATVGHLLITAAKIARNKGISDGGYRIVINTNDDGGQTVFHLHIHLLGGRQFIFPPG